MARIDERRKILESKLKEMAEDGGGGGVGGAAGVAVPAS